MRVNGEVNNPPSALEKQLIKPEDQETFENLPISVSLHLLGLMKTVVKNEITPSTVNAACNCAAEIHKILKLSCSKGY